MVVHVANAPRTPEEATDYHQLWAGFVNGITIPETFTHIFQVVGRNTDTGYYYCMAMGYAEHRRIIAANQGHLQRSAVLSILVNLAVLRRQSPHFIQIYTQALQQEPNLPVNNWGQACRIVSHPAYLRNDLGLTFEPPSSSSNPWTIRTAWCKDQANALVLPLLTPCRTCWRLLMHISTCVRPPIHSKGTS